VGYQRIGVVVLKLTLWVSSNFEDQLWMLWIHWLWGRRQQLGVNLGHTLFYLLLCLSLALRGLTRTFIFLLILLRHLSSGLFSLLMRRLALRLGSGGCLGRPRVIAWGSSLVRLHVPVGLLVQTSDFAQLELIANEVGRPVSLIVSLLVPRG
jgi:hypothetical protein